MIEDEILNPQFLCQPCSIEHCAMMFLVGLEAVTVFIQTEGLAHQPVGTLGILTALSTERLVAQTAETPTIRQLSFKSELTLFRGMNVKTKQRKTSCLELVTIFQAIHRNKISNTICFFLRKNLTADVG